MVKWLLLFWFLTEQSSIAANWNVGVLPAAFSEEVKTGPKVNGAAIRAYTSYLKWKSHGVALGPYFQVEAITNNKSPMLISGAAARLGKLLFFEIGFGYYRFNTDDSGFLIQGMIGKFWANVFVAIQYNGYNMVGSTNATIPDSYGPMFGIKF